MLPREYNSHCSLQHSPHKQDHASNTDRIEAENRRPSGFTFHSFAMHPLLRRWETARNYVKTMTCESCDTVKDGR